MGRHRPRHNSSRLAGGRLVCAIDPGAASTIVMLADLADLERGDGDRNAERQTPDIITPKILGLSAVATRGMRDGRLSDAAAFTEGLRQAAERAWASAGLTVRDVVMSYSSPKILVRALRGEHAPAEVRAALVQAGLAGLHVQSLDEQDEHGESRTLTRIVAAPREDVASIRDAVSEAGLEASKIAVGLYAAARGALSQSQWFGEALVIDMGACQTGVAHVAEGVLANAVTAPLGGRHITGDLVQVLDITAEGAGRLKMAVSVGAEWDQGRGGDAIHTAPGGASVGERTIRASEARDVIEPRVLETLELIAGAIARWNVSPGAPVILTGGAANLGGLAGLASRALGRRC